MAEVVDQNRGHCSQTYNTQGSVDQRTGSSCVPANNRTGSIVLNAVGCHEVTVKFSVCCVDMSTVRGFFEKLAISHRVEYDTVRVLLFEAVVSLVMNVS